ncbi:tail fiber domain-containing protein [Marivirga sp.]|uniref:tail fiber domain-containing protein n=1 Tax=Marivirga sp. TaxID=2018662 RepID=UPI002D7E7EC4|nr:tail fiber domain-containing protein [Marivirga sp.]HET8859379.1 tail fiber domain-containing protein [Marivirga sp.]
MKKIYLLISLLLISLSVMAQKLPFQGYLEESGVPVNGTRTFNFELTDYGWTETIANVQIDNGLYNVVLGQTNLLPDSIFSDRNETPLTITLDTTLLGTVMLYKSLGGHSSSANLGLVTVKDPNGNVKGELMHFPTNNSGSVVLYGANDSTKVILGSAGGGYGGFLGLYDSLRNSGLQLRVTNKGRGNLFTSNESHKNVGWFGGLGNDGFVQLTSYDDTDTISGAILLGTLSNSRQPGLYIEGSKQPNYGLGRLEILDLPDGQEAARLEIARSNGGGRAEIFVNQDNSGGDPAGSNGALNLWGDSSPNFIFSSASYQDHDLPNAQVYGSIGDGTGWYYTSLDYGAGRSSDNSSESGFMNFQNNKAGASYGTLTLTANLYENGGGGIEVRDTVGNTTIVLEGKTGDIISNRGAVRSRELTLDANNIPIIHMRSNGNGSALNVWTNQPDGGGWFFSGINADTYNNGTNAYGDLNIFNNNTPIISLYGESGSAHANQFYARNDFSMEGNYFNVYKTNDPNGADPTGTTAELYIRGNGTPNVRLGGKPWENHGLGNITVFGSIDTGGGWAHEVANIGASTDGTSEWGNIVLRRNATDMISLDGNVGTITVADPWVAGVGVHIEGSNGSIVLTGEMKSMTANVGDYFAGTGIFIDGNTGNLSTTGSILTNGILNVNDELGNQSVLVRGNTANPSIEHPKFVLGNVENQNHALLHLKGDDNTGLNDLRIRLDVIPDGLGSSFSSMKMYNALYQEAITLDASTGVINATGGVTQNSDRRLKENILVLDNALSNTLKMRGVSYNWIDKNKSQKNQIGVIAQEVEAIYPEFVHTDENGMKAVNYAQMTAVLIEAIKELHHKVENLEKENAALTTALNETKTLSEKINKLEKLLLEDKKVASN